jgi:hypothetical protein
MSATTAAAAAAVRGTSGLDGLLRGVCCEQVTKQKIWNHEQSGVSLHAMQARSQRTTAYKRIDS